MKLDKISEENITYHLMLARNKTLLSINHLSDTVRRIIPYGSINVDLSYTLSRLHKIHDDLSSLMRDVPDAIHTLEAKDDAAAYNVVQGFGQIAMLAGAYAVSMNASFKNVAAEVYTRAGLNPQSKGHVLEILLRNQINSSPSNLILRKCAILAPDVTSPGADILISKNGTFLKGGIQAKTGVSNSAIYSTIKKVRSGQYIDQELIGTKEAAYLYNLKAAKISKKTGELLQVMKNSGVSNKTVTHISSIATKAPSVVSIASTVAKGSIFGTIVGGGIEAIVSGKAYSEGKISGTQYANNVVRESIAGGVATAAAIGVGIVMTATAVPALVTTAAVVVTGIGVSWVLSSIWDSLLKF